MSPAPATVVEGDTLQLTATATNAHGQVVTGAEFVWASGDTAVARGTASITATAGEASGDAHVTVEIDFDRVALVALYHATDGPNWVDNTNWLTDARLDEWYGVDTDAAGRVVGIGLVGRWDIEAQQFVSHGLRGELPADLANLTELEFLFLGHNDLTGAIPPELGDLTNLWGLRLGYNDLTGPIPSELGNLARLEHLNLSRNELTGSIPPELGNLAELRDLRLWGNNLTGSIPPELDDLAELTTLDLGFNILVGPIPQSLLQLDQLREFRFVRGQDVCVPGTAAFVAWLEGIETLDTEAGSLCNAVDVAALESLYEWTDGANWTESDGWLGGDAVEEWYGVTADSLGRVTELDLEGNDLTGRLSSTLSDLTRMTVLRIGDNALTGRLPLGFAGLPLVEFGYSETELCAPVEASFQGWLSAIASLDGTGLDCVPLSDREILEALTQCG